MNAAERGCASPSSIVGLALLLTTGCSPLLTGTSGEGAKVPGASSGGIAVAVVHDGDGSLLGVEQLTLLDKALADRGFVAQLLPVAKQPLPRATAARIALLRGWAQEAQLAHLILLELEPTYFAQLEGRYRWTVTAKAQVGATREGAPLETSKAAIPIFLRFDHQRDDAAIVEARDAWVRVAIRAMDAYVSLQR